MPPGTRGVLAGLVASLTLVALPAVGQPAGALQRLGLAGYPPDTRPPGFSGATVDGFPLSLGSLRSRVVLLNFWASWCLECRAELPVLERLHRDYVSQGLTVVALNFREEPGTDDFGRVLGQRGAAPLILLDDHVEDVTQLRQGLFSRGHEGITAGDGGHVGNPRAIILAIEHDLIGVEAWAVHVERIPRHGISGSSSACARSRNCCRGKLRRGTTEPSVRAVRTALPAPRSICESSQRRRRTVRVLSVNADQPATTRTNRAGYDSPFPMGLVGRVWCPSHPPLPS